jgi:tRNA-modifying protein YgfZ
LSHWTAFLLARGAAFDADAVSAFGDGPGERVAARDAAVVCPLGPLGALSVRGPDAASFLQGQLSNDVTALAPGSGQLSAWCSPKGRVLANFTLRCIAGDHFELLLPRLLLDSVQRRLAMFVLRAKVTLGDASEAAIRIGVGGPAAAARIAELGAAAPPPLRWTAIEGGSVAALPGSRFIASVDPAAAPGLWERLAGVARPAGFPCWRWLTIRAGVPVILPPTQDQFIPQMLNLDVLGGISFHKGCYAGQEIVARTQYLGRLKERLALAHAQSAPVPGTRLYATAFGDQACGTVINAVAAPGGGADLLCVAQLVASAAGELRAEAADGPALALLPLPYAVPMPSEPRGGTA